jgi:phage protein D
MSQPPQGSTAAVDLSVRVGTPPVALADALQQKVIRTVVDTSLHLPGMFEVTFNDFRGDVSRGAGLEIGKGLEVWAGVADGSPRRLITGEITSVEGDFHAGHAHLVVRGYDRSHRLQRVRRTRTFLNMTDSDIARKVASEAGLKIGRIDATKATHAHLSQVDETDWDFLQARAKETGHELGMVDDDFYFRRATTTADGPSPLQLTLQKNLLSFRPRVSAGNLTPEVEVRVWDPAAAKTVSVKAGMRAGVARLKGADPAALGKAFAHSSLRPPPPQPKPGAGNLGPEPSAQAFVVTDRPVAAGSSANRAAQEMLDSVVEHLGSTFAEADGQAIGIPLLQAGTVVQVDGIPAPFGGTWAVSSARHVIEGRESGYRTSFSVTGRQNRSLLGLVSSGGAQPRKRVMDGLVCGIVTNINDPSKQGRVKVTLPWLSPNYESDWAPTVQPGAGQRSGALFLHDVGDEVLVGFEMGDPRRPYVMGGVLNQQTVYDLGAPAVKATGATAAVVQRGFTSPAGNRLVFHDELPPGTAAAPPTASQVTLGTKDGNLSLAIDQVAGTVTLMCKPAPPNSKSAAGRLTIECGNAGTIDIKTGPGGTVNVDGGSSLNVKAQASVKIESNGVVSVKGSQIRLN